MTKKETISVYGIIWGPIILSFLVAGFLLVKLFQQNRHLPTFDFFEEYKPILAYRDIKFEEKRPEWPDELNNPFLVRKKATTKKVLKPVKKVRLRLTSIVSSPKGRSCLINEKIFREGDLLPKGRIVAIGEKWIKIKLLSEDKEVILRVGEELYL